MNALRTCSALLVGLLATLMLTPGAAFAHAGLSDSSPANKEVVDALPAQITLEFSEEVRAPAFVVVTGPDGRTHESGKPTVEGNVAVQNVEAPAAGTASGEWTVGYRVVSADGHPVTGHVQFRVAAGATPNGSPDASASASATPSPTVLAPKDTVASDEPQEDNSSRAPVFIAALLAVLLVAVAAVTARRKRSQQ